jgi:hypothetical protein
MNIELIGLAMDVPVHAGGRNNNNYEAGFDDGVHDAETQQSDGECYMVVTAGW